MEISACSASTTEQENSAASWHVLATESEKLTMKIKLCTSLLYWTLCFVSAPREQIMVVFQYCWCNKNAYEEVHIEWVRSSLINEKKISKFMFTEVPTWKIISEYTGIKNSTVCIEKNEWIWEYFYTVMTEKFTNNKKKNSTYFVQLAVLKKERPYPH
jgi:hypothetical protein